MHPLAFMTTWLMGAASAGDKEARAGLSMIWPALVADLNWDLEQMRSGIVKSHKPDIEDGLRRLLGGIAMMNGENCTKTILRALKSMSGEYASRAMAASLVTLPKEKLLPVLRDMLAVLEQSEVKK